MKNEAEAWFAQAKSDLRASRHSLDTKDYDWSCFQAQQAAEKGLKALYLERFNELRKVHDLFFLAKKLDAPDDILTSCAKLSRVYVETRYPGASGKIPAKKFTNKDASECIKIASEVLSWLKKNL